MTATNTGGSAQATSDTLVVLAVPHVLKLGPVTGKVGAVATITGRGFGAKRGSGRVFFGTRAATAYLSWSSTRIKVRVPAIAKGRKTVTVKTAGGKSNGRYFTRV